MLSRYGLHWWTIRVPATNVQPHSAKLSPGGRDAADNDRREPPPSSGISPRPPVFSFNAWMLFYYTRTEAFRRVPSMIRSDLWRGRGAPLIRADQNAQSPVRRVFAFTFDFGCKKFARVLFVLCAMFEWATSLSSLALPRFTEVKGFCKMRIQCSHPPIHMPAAKRHASSSSEVFILLARAMKACSQALASFVTTRGVRVGGLKGRYGISMRSSHATNCSVHKCGLAP